MCLWLVVRHCALCAVLCCAVMWLRDRWPTNRDMYSFQFMHINVCSAYWNQPPFDFTRYTSTSLMYFCLHIYPRDPKCVTNNRTQSTRDWDKFWTFSCRCRFFCFFFFLICFFLKESRERMMKRRIEACNHFSLSWIKYGKNFRNACLLFFLRFRFDRLRLDLSFVIFTKINSKFRIFERINFSYREEDEKREKKKPVQKWDAIAVVIVIDIVARFLI